MKKKVTITVSPGLSHPELVRVLFQRGKLNKHGLFPDDVNIARHELVFDFCPDLATDNPDELVKLASYQESDFAAICQPLFPDKQLIVVMKDVITET